MNDHGNEGTPPDRKQWEDHLVRWRQAEAQFEVDAAEGVRAADRLFLELTGASEQSPRRVVRDFVLKRGRPLGSATQAPAFGADPNPLEALVDLGRGVQESLRLARQGQAAARGISAAREHRSATADDFREAMELYRGEMSRLLGVKREELSALKSFAEDTGNVAAQAARERIIAEKLVREAMMPLEQAEERIDRRRIIRSGTIQIVGSLVLGLLMFAAVVWVLSL